MQDNIKNWYLREYATDELGGEIDSMATFQDLFDALDNYKDVYNVLGVYDSIVRERAFQRLAQIINCDYSYIYEQWLKAM